MVPARRVPRLREISSYSPQLRGHEHGLCNEAELQPGPEQTYRIARQDGGRSFGVALPAPGC